MTGKEKKMQSHNISRERGGGKLAGKSKSHYEWLVMARQRRGGMRWLESRIFSLLSVVMKMLSVNFEG